MCTGIYNGNIIAIQNEFRVLPDNLLKNEDYMKQKAQLVWACMSIDRCIGQRYITGVNW